MIDPDISDELRAIRTALEVHPRPTIAGGQLLPLIRSAAPALDVRALVGIPKGPGALKDFLSRFAPNLVEPIGRQGADVIYRIHGRNAEPVPRSKSADVWRAFVSPSSPRHLVIDPSTGELTVRDDPVSAAGEIEMERASTGDHDAMRAAFEASLPAPAAEELKRHAGADADFPTWIQNLKQHLPQVSRSWGIYRRKRLAELFASRIDALGLDETQRRAALDQIANAEASAYDRPKPGVAATPHEPRKSGRPDEPSNTQRARRVAHATIDLLDYEQLRSLWVPLGVALDATQSGN